MQDELYVVEECTGKRRKAVELTCQYCGKKYLHRKDRAERSKYCSPKCKNESEKDQLTFKCHNCGTIFQRAKAQCKRSKHGYYFCSRECKDNSQSLEGNGEGFRPKNWGNVKSPCVVCGKLTINKYCSKKCLNIDKKRVEYDVVKEIALKDFGKDSKHLLANSGKYRQIRTYAKQLYNKKNDGVCKATSYDKHVEVCHIIALSKFNENTPIGVMNDERNILLLSPNAHWELDHGLLELKDIDPATEQSHNLFLDECKRKGWLGYDKTRMGRNQKTKKR